MKLCAHLASRRSLDSANSAHRPGAVRRGRGRRTWRRWAGLAVVVVFAVPAAVRAQDNPVAEPATKQDQEAGKTKPKEPAWKPLFDGKSLQGWKASNFGGEGEVVVKEGILNMGMGSPLTGITYTEKTLKCDYELQVEAMRIDGNDFFSTITFPVNESFCSLVVGGWGGAVVGISCINRADASENETTKYMKFESKKWYRIRVQVRKNHIRAWIDDKSVVDVDIKNRQLSTRTEVFLTEPLGISSYITRAGIRKIELRELPPETGK